MGVVVIKASCQRSLVSLVFCLVAGTLLCSGETRHEKKLVLKDGHPPPKVHSNCDEQVLVAQKDKDRPPAKEDKRSYITKLLDGFKQGAVRKNGVLLTAKAEIKPDPKGNQVLLHWSLDYDGPRQPLIVLKPALEGPGANQTYVVFYLVHGDGKAYPVPVQGSVPSFPIFVGKPHFIEVKKGEVGQGTITVTNSLVIETLAREKWPEKFQTFAPCRVFVQLRHQPALRGELVLRRLFDPDEPVEHVDLDAWTGSLQTELIELSVKALTSR